jgi:hypothetical protein
MYALDSALLIPSFLFMIDCLSGFSLSWIKDRNELHIPLLVPEEQKTPNAPLRG